MPQEPGGAVERLGRLLRLRRAAQQRVIDAGGRHVARHFRPRDRDLVRVRVVKLARDKHGEFTPDEFRDTPRAFAGDAEALEDMLASAFDEFPELYRPLTEDRNRAWVERLDELLELPALDDELDDEPVDELLVLEELLDGELEELLDGELEELLDGVLDELDDEAPPAEEPSELLDDDPSGEVGSDVQPASPAAITAMGAPDNSSRKSRRRFRSTGSDCRTLVLRRSFGMTILH